MIEERKNLDFDQKELTYLLFGSQKVHKDYHDLVSLITSDPILRRDYSWFEMSREQKIENYLMQVRRLYDLGKEKYFLKNENDYFTWIYYVYHGNVRIK